MAKSKSTSRNSASLNPLVTGLVGASIGFVGGLLVERSQKVTERIESKGKEAIKQGKIAAEETKARGKELIAIGSEKVREKLSLADQFVQRMKDGPTDAKWTRQPIDPDELDEYPLSQSEKRVIKGNLYLIHTRDSSDGYFLDAFPGKELGSYSVRISSRRRDHSWATLAEAKKAAEDKDLLMKALTDYEKRHNPGSDGPVTAYRQEILDAFFQNSEIKPDEVKDGSVSLEVYLYPSIKDYEAEKGPINEKSFSIDDIEELAKIKPRMIAEVYAICCDDDADDQNPEILDIVPVEITGQLAKKQKKDKPAAKKR